MTFTGPLLTRLRADTVRFIDFSPVTLTLRMYDIIDDGTGGKKEVFAGNRPPQVFSLLEPSSSNYKMKSTQPEGTNTIYDYMLLGKHDAVIGLYDEFTYDGNEYRVENILSENGYERRAVVLRTGARS